MSAWELKEAMLQQVKADAWDEGYEAGTDAGDLEQVTPNPYARSETP